VRGPLFISEEQLDEHLHSTVDWWARRRSGIPGLRGRDVLRLHHNHHVYQQFWEYAWMVAVKEEWEHDCWDRGVRPTREAWQAARTPRKPMRPYRPPIIPHDQALLEECLHYLLSPSSVSEDSKLITRPALLAVFVVRAT
jgi:hypothetical protein